MSRLLIGALANWFDTLRVGSRATDSSRHGLRGIVADALIESALDVSHALDTLMPASICVAIIQLELASRLLMRAIRANSAFHSRCIVFGSPH